MKARDNKLPLVPGRDSVPFVVALAACLAAGVAANGVERAGQVLLLAACTTGAAVLTALVASKLGHRARIPGALTAGLLFVLTLPAGTAVLPATGAMVFGWIAAREVFRTVQRSFVHPAVLAHVFLGLTWPQAMGAASLWLPPEGQVVSGADWFFLRGPGGALGGASALVCALAAVVLIALRLVPWRVVFSVPLGMAVALGVLGWAGVPGSGYSLSTHLLLGAVTFGAVFLATDPASSPSSNGGRWWHGATIGFVVIVLRLSNPARPEGTLAAILLASIFAPLVDRAMAAGRRRRDQVFHG